MYYEGVNIFMAELSIQASEISKSYKLYSKPIDRLKESISFTRKKYHSEFNALTDVTFDLKRGEALGIVGRNGSGKSTLLKIVTGVIAPSSGVVKVSGRIAAILELGAGFNPEYNGIQNIYLNGTMLGLSRDEISELLPEILEFAEIGDFIYQPVKNYSSGMFVRLAFAFSSCVRPDILIIDEALSVGDFFFVQKCYAKISQVQKSGVSVLFVTHSLGDMLRFCDRAILLDRGRVTYDGDPQITMQKYLSQKENDNNVIQKKSSESCVKDKTDDWIPDGCSIDISHAHLETTGGALCTRIGISNDEGRSTNTFRVGEVIIFYSEYEIVDNLEVPICGVTLFDRQGNVIHGKHSLHHKNTHLDEVLCKTILRVRISIKLDVAPGEYSYVLGLSSMDKYHYDNDLLFRHAELMHSMRRVLHVSQIGTFFVRGNDNGVETPFNGLCNLDGDCKVETVLLQN